MNQPMYERELSDALRLRLRTQFEADATTDSIQTPINQLCEGILNAAKAIQSGETPELSITIDISNVFGLGDEPEADLEDEAKPMKKGRSKRG